MRIFLNNSDTENQINKNKRKMHTYIISETSVYGYTVLFRKLMKGTVKQTRSSMVTTMLLVLCSSSHALISVPFVCVRALGSAPVPGATFFSSVALLPSSRIFL